jgi:Tfp pilus assembly protein FimT
LLEVTVVVVVILILAGITAPKILGMIEVQRLQATTRAYASFLQESRYRAEQDAQWYQVLVDLSDPNTAIVYLDINGDGTRQTSEPAMQVPFPITMPDPAGAGIPAGFGNANLLGATPLTVDTTPATWNCQHGSGCLNPVQVAGLQFNERGLPCQRVSSTAACTNSTQINGALGLVAAPVAWITYFAYPTSTSGTLYKAVTVTPAGRIKVWSYQSGGGGGTWQ